MKEYAFGIDLGGTTAKIGLFTTSGALLEKWEVATDTSHAGEHILENLAAAVLGKMKEQSIQPEQVEGVGVGVPGPLPAQRQGLFPAFCPARQRPDFSECAHRRWRCRWELPTFPAVRRWS